MNQLNQLLSRLPIQPLMLAVAAYLAFEYLSFTNQLKVIDYSDSPLLLKQAELASTEEQSAKIEKEVVKYQNFLKQLDQKRSELRELAQQLDGMKTTLNDSLDIPAFMETVVSEAKKTGVTVTSLKPTDVVTKEFYAEQTFELAFRGVYVQTVMFLYRLSQSPTLVRVDDVSMKPSGSDTSRYVQLDGVIKLKGYHSIRVKGEAATANSATAPGATAPAGGSG